MQFAITARWELLLEIGYNNRSSRAKIKIPVNWATSWPVRPCLKALLSLGGRGGLHRLKRKAAAVCLRSIADAPPYTP